MPGKKGKPRHIPASAKASAGKKVSKGRFIVIEGSDGSGKATQAKLLYKFLKSKKIPAEMIAFPNYSSTWGKVIVRYLHGEFGNALQVDPYLASILYAGDRLMSAKKIQKWIDAGKIVVCDRYTASNIAHQAAKIKSGKQKYIDWMEDFEYNQNGIPKEDVVVYLSVPIQASQKLMKGRKLDIHEKNKKYLADVSKVYEKLAKRDHWKKINCFENKKLLSKKEIHNQILKVLKIHVSN